MMFDQFEKSLPNMLLVCCGGGVDNVHDMVILKVLIPKYLYSQNMITRILRQTLIVKPKS